MRDTLENLYFGNITPNDQIVKSRTALKKAMEQFKQELVAYLAYYNTKRIKLSLGGLPPAVYREKMQSIA